MTRLARRLRAMSREELSWRLRTQLRTHAEEAACAIRTPRWDRKDVRNALAVETFSPGLQAALANGDWRAAHAALRGVLQGRPSRFVLNPASAADLRREISIRWPGAEADAVRRATAIAGGSFDLLGYRGLSFDSEATTPTWVAPDFVVNE